MTSDDLPVARVGTLKSGPSDWYWTTWRNVHCAMDAAAPAAPAEDAPPLLLKTSERTPGPCATCCSRRAGARGRGRGRRRRVGVCWRSGKYRPSEYVEAHRRGQRVNHFRNSSAITKRTRRATCARRAVHGAVYGFFPVPPRASRPPPLPPAEAAKLRRARSRSSAGTKFVAEHRRRRAAPARARRAARAAAPRAARGRRRRGSAAGRPEPRPRIYPLRGSASSRTPTDDRAALTSAPAAHRRARVRHAAVRARTSFHPLEIWMNADGIARFGTEKCERERDDGDERSLSAWRCFRRG